ncbi:DHA2 family efflux MFS transporter permease subunit [Pseudokordiimonas caeni]|uniref:DHA2 family efflux MFS transporter permease subunit n=1 Tax=Pseudokordiimonas caeni TaxID=2997908 RepID=UPI002811070B|nr:DHA2 family efflux MFS transporter permease subunit [Pseudokordiimonas caeni]
MPFETASRVTTAAQLDDPATMAKSRKFLIFGVMAFGQFMALLDIQIVAASVNDIQAGLLAGPDEISWVQTSYLMAELVMIPFSAFLAQALSTRWLFGVSAALFTLSSILCGFAWNIESMIAFRALQGFTGGAMIPTVFATGFTLFTGTERAMIPAILGIVSVLAPALGPTVGGLITELADWRWIFFVNVLPGLAVTIAVVMLLRIDRPDIGMLKRIDYMHLVAMILFLAGLEYVLEEGPKNDWFNDTTIAIGAWLAIVGFSFFIERAFFSKSPLVQLSPFRSYSFAFACVFNLVIGFGLYASIYLVPLYLGRIRGFDSLEIGTTVFVVGISQVISTILAARLINHIDRRIIITVGLVLFAFSMELTSSMTSEWGFAELLVPQLMRGLSIMLCIVPSVNMALDGFAGAELRHASGLFNLMRNLGGAIGIAVTTTWLNDFTKIEAMKIGEALGLNGQNAAAAGEAAAALTAHAAAIVNDPAIAGQMATGVLGQLVQREAATLAFNEIFAVMGVMFFLALLMVPFSGSHRPAAKAPVAEH